MTMHRQSHFSVLSINFGEVLARSPACVMTLVASLMALFSPSPSFSAQPTMQGPTQAELDRADTDSINWVTDNKGYMGTRFSTLSEINPRNIRNLSEVCSFDLGETGSFQNGPIVYDGLLYTTTGLTTVAIDAATCAKKWEYHHKPSYVLVSNKITRVRPSLAAALFAAPPTVT